MTAAETSRAYDLPPSEIETWVDDGKRVMVNVFIGYTQDWREKYERLLKVLRAIQFALKWRCGRFPGLLMEVVHVFARGAAESR